MLVDLGNLKYRQFLSHASRVRLEQPKQARTLTPRAQNVRQPRSAVRVLQLARPVRPYRTLRHKQQRASATRPARQQAQAQP